MRVLILGAGDHGRMVVDYLLQNRARGEDVEPIGYVDDDSALLGKRFFDLPVWGPISQRHRVAYDAAIVAIGENSARARIFEKLERQKERFVNVIHPTAVLARDVNLGSGVVVGANVVVSIGSIVGDNVILSSGCTVGHDSEINRHARVGPGVHLGGHVTVGEGALLGIGAVAIPGRHIRAWSIVGAGGCVVSDIPASVTAVGVPARVIERRGTQ